MMIDKFTTRRGLNSVSEWINLFKFWIVENMFKLDIDLWMNLDIGF